MNIIDFITLFEYETKALGMHFLVLMYVCECEHADAEADVLIH
jgi:hypothetical protein